MISHSSLEFIKELQAEGHEVFYNGSGDPELYRNNVKHISYSIPLRICRMNGKKDSTQVIRVEVDSLYVFIQNDNIVTKYTYGDNIFIIPIESLE